MEHVTVAGAVTLSRERSVRQPIMPKGVRGREERGGSPQHNTKQNKPARSRTRRDKEKRKREGKKERRKGGGRRERKWDP